MKLNTDVIRTKIFVRVGKRDKDGATLLQPIIWQNAVVCFLVWPRSAKNVKHSLVNVCLQFSRVSEREREMKEERRSRKGRNCATRFQGSCLHTDGITSGLLSCVAPRWCKSQAWIKKHLQDRHLISLIGWMHSAALKYDLHQRRYHHHHYVETLLNFNEHDGWCAAIFRCHIYKIPSGQCYRNLFRTSRFFAILFGMFFTFLCCEEKH